MNSLHGAVHGIWSNESVSCSVFCWKVAGEGKWSNSKTRLEQTWKPFPPWFMRSGASGASGAVEQMPTILLHFDLASTISVIVLFSSLLQEVEDTDAYDR